MYNANIKMVLESKATKIMTHKKKSLPKTLFPFIWHFLRSYKSAVTMYSVLSIMAGFWGPFNSILIKHLMNLVPQLSASNISILIVPASLFPLNFILLDNFTWRGIWYIRAKFLPVIINQIVGESMQHALGKSYQFYQDSLSGKLSKHIRNLADGIEDLLCGVASNFLRGTSLLLTAMGAAYFANPIFFYFFCCVLGAWVVLFAGISTVMSPKLVSLSDMQDSCESIVVGQLVDALSNHSNVSIFSRQHYERTRMVPFFEQQQKAYTASTLYSIILHSIEGVFIATVMACSCYFLVYLYKKNLVTLGDFALILGLSTHVGHMMWFTMAEVEKFNKAVGRCRRSLMVLMSPLEIQDKPNAEILDCNGGQVTLDNVTFHYNNTEPLFLNLSITISPGQKVGLVGHFGGGKSTFVNLILRLYDVTEGAIFIDGQDIRNVTQDSLREHISMIPQDPSLFQRSLMENIRYGRINATDKEVIEAAKKASAHDFIEKFSQGYDTLVGERGVKLSGGQRQCIAIARAILKNAPILILDEATSQLDSVTESLIQESLWNLMQHKTTIVIAHRLSTLLHMDRILVFDKGKIVEDGTHSALLAKSGLYKRLWDAQARGGSRHCEH